MADNIFYRDAFIKTKVIQDAEGNLKLDTPFICYHQTIIENGKNHYCYITQDLKDKEVVVYIHYAIADEDKVKSFAGYLGNDWKNVQKNTDAKKHCLLKKEDAFATVTVNPLTQVETVVKYDGVDKLELAHPYLAEDSVLKK